MHRAPRVEERSDVPSIILETADSKMVLVYETAADVPGERCVLMGSGAPVETPEEALAAFRKFYPGKAKDTIAQCIVHQGWKKDPTSRASSWRRPIRRWCSCMKPRQTCPASVAC